MDSSGILSSTEREFSQSKSNEPASSGGKGSLWSSRSAKCLLLGGLAASYGCSIGGAMERSAGKAAEVARVFGGLHMQDVGLEPAGGTSRFENYSPLIRDAEAATTTSSCVQGIIVGGVGALLIQNPLPLLLGLGGCLLGANAQQMTGNEFQVNNHEIYDQQFPSIASFSNGNFVVIWESYDQDAGGSDYGIYGQLFDGNANRTGNEFQANTYTASHQYFPSVTSFSNGNFIVIWTSNDQDGSDYGVYGQVFDVNANRIGNEFQVNTYTSGDQRYPSVASFSNGNFIVVWSGSGQGDSGGAYGQLFDGNATRIGNEFQANTYTNNNQRYPSVASFSNGNFVVTWESYGQDAGGSDYGIYGQLFDGNINRIGNEFQVNTYTSNTQAGPSVASFSNGNFVVTWQSYNQDAGGSDYGIYGQLFDGNETGIGNEFQVNTYTSGDQRYPSVASFGNGNFVVVWSGRGQGDSSGAYGQLFDGNATRIGNEFQANTYENDYQERPSVASFDNGNFVVAWNSDGRDFFGFGGYGVYGQLFSTPWNFSSTSSTTTTTTSLFTTTSSTTTSTTSELPSSSSSRSISSSSSIVSDSTSNPPRSSTDSTILSSSSVISSSTSAQLNSSTYVTTANSSSVISSSTNTQLSSSIYVTTVSSSSNPSSSLTSRLTSSTSPTTVTSSTIPTTFTTQETLASTGGSPSVLWISLGLIGGILCICLGGGALYILQRRKREQPDVEEDTDFKMKPVTEIGHKKIGGKYFQLSKITNKEAEKIYEQTGYMIRFPKVVKKIPYVIGRGKFGTTKLAQKIENSEYVVSKKVKGKENITASKEEADLQKAAKGENVLPIYNTIELDNAIYHFMPLAGYGNGIEIQQQLSALNNHVLATEISKFIAKDLLTGLQTMHSNGIYHLDIKPENIVFDKTGAAFITDFGCAKKLGDTNDGVFSRALGDNRYFSPERLHSCKDDRGTFDPEKADVWAAGLTLLQMIKGKSPCDLLEMPLNFTKRIKTCTPGHFLDSLDQFKELKRPEKGTAWWVIKRMLDPNPETRLTAEEVLKAPCFKGLNNRTKSDVFEDMRADKFVQRGIKRKELNMGDYHSVSRCIDEMSKAPYNKRSESADVNILFDKVGESYANYPKREEQHYANLSFVQ